MPLALEAEPGPSAPEAPTGLAPELKVDGLRCRELVELLKRQNESLEILKAQARRPE
ncbi:hypothetical protein [Phenylobacterium sp.]|uniref:hypothetical protein n=1 Tax=Phenylobacterium sp. TaxID=1871053 RepID=UPI00391DA03B